MRLPAQFPINADNLEADAQEIAFSLHHQNSVLNREITDPQVHSLYLHSIAVSLRRIADALEERNKNVPAK